MWIKTVLLFSFQSFMCFIYLNCYIALTRPLSMMLNKTREKRHPCLVSHFRGKEFFLLLLIVKLALLFFVDILIRWWKFPSILILLSFTMSRCQSLYNACLHLLRWSHICCCCCFAVIVDMVNFTDGFLNVKPVLHSWNNPHLVMIY